MVVLLQTRRERFTSPFSSVYLLKNLHMNKKLLALLFAVPGFGLAQTTYKVMGFAPSLDQVAVESKDVTGHDVALANTRNGGWYADAKTQEVGVAQDRNPQFRIVKTGTAGVYKLYSVKNNKFVAYTAVGSGGNKTKFVEDGNDPKTNWRIVPNIGANGTANNFDIFPGSVSNPNEGTPAWNAVGGVNVNARIGLWRADDGGSCWSIEVVTQQQLKFFSNYSATNDSYFMTIRDNYVHKNGENFTADKNLQFGDDNYRFQLVGTPDNFRIYNAATGQPIGTEVGAGLNNKDKEDNNRYRANKESYFSAQSYGGRVYVKETRKPNLYLNFRDGFLSTWNHEFAWTTRDPGSQILFTTEDGILAEAAKKLASELKAQYPDSKFGKDLGLYPQSMKSVVDTCAKKLEEAQGSSLSIAEKKQKYNEALEYVDYLKTASLNLPQNGDLLYIAATRDNKVKYFTSQVHANGDVDYDRKSSEGFLTTKATKTADAVFLYTLEGQKVTLTSVATGRRVVLGERAEDHVFYPTMATQASDGTKFEVSSRDGKYVFEAEGHFLASDANMDYALTYNSFSAFAGLRLERVGTTLPVHIGDGGTASFWSPVEYSVPEGVTAYSVKIVNNMARLTKITTNVPKNTAVFLYGPASSDVNLTVVPDGQTPALQDNILKGGATATTLEGTAFMLKKNGTGLVRVNGAVPAFKAYFTATKAQVRELLDRGLTGVVSVATEAEDAPVYDLSGRRVQHTTKGGVYVTNGKKFIAK